MLTKLKLASLNRLLIGAAVATLTLSTSATALADNKEGNMQIVYIDGVKYNIYNVAKGDTLYSLSKRFGISIDEITRINPSLVDGLKAGQALKIPLAKQNQKKVKKPKKQFQTHTVKRGETLFGISRRYEISLNTLIEDNNVDPAHLAVGTKLYIRRSEIGQTSEQEAQTEVAEQSAAMNSVTDNDYSFHVVHKGENAENIASRFGTTVEQLLALNQMKSSNEICRGAIIKVPKILSDSTQSTSDGSKESEAKPQSVVFRSLKAGETARVALMLPFTQRGTTSQNYIDFYQGFLMGIDSIRMAGHSIDLDVFDTCHDHTTIASILDSEPLSQADLIVGPVYEDEVIPVSRHAEKRNIPIVSPLANMSQFESNAVFQMSPRLDAKYTKIANLFDGSRRVVVITSDTIDSDFQTEAEKIIGTTPHLTHLYRYEHQSIIEEREKARAEGKEVEPTPSDMAPLLESDEPTVFVILSSDEIEVDRILAALASARISLTARSCKVAPYVVFGNSRWNRYRNIDRSLFFANNVVMLSTYHIDRSNARVLNFSKSYTKAFNTLPSLYTYRGYDAAIIFVSSLYSNIGTGLQGEHFTPLQTPYNFDTSDHTTRRNNEWVRVNYNSNYTITTE